MRTRSLAWVVTSVLGAGVASAWGLACSASDQGTGTAPTADAGSDTAAQVTTPGLAVGLPCTDSIDSIYADPGPLPAGNGTIIRCAADGELSAADLYAKAQANVSFDDAPATNIGYQGKPFTSGVKMYRLLITTERGDAANTHGYQSAKVFIPTTPRAAQVPMIIGARGSRGQGPSCVASKEKTGLDSINGDYEAMAYPIAGAGFPIIIPDLGGYANFGGANNPISGYIAYKDVAKGTLDGGRALKSFVTSGLMDQTVLVGHSQGGHSALSALVLAESYAPELNVTAIATYAPAWVNSRTWGGVFQVQAQYPIEQYGFISGVDVWYHYTHSELLDGPGHGTDVFAADKKAAIKQWVETQCWGKDAWSTLLSVAQNGTLDGGVSDAGGPTFVGALYDSKFVNSVKYAAAFGQDCAAGDDVCAKWIARYVEDRPHLTGKAATTPLIVVHGTDDDTVTPDRLQCATDRLKADKANLTDCVVKGFGHQGVVRARSEYIVNWIAARTLGEPEPASACDDPSVFVDDAGAPIQCANPPPND